LENDPIVEALSTTTAEIEPSPMTNEAPNPVVVPAAPPAPGPRPSIGVVPSIAPAHVPTATAPAFERVSFRDRATSPLTTASRTQGAPSDAVVSAVAPVLEAPLSLEAPVAPRPEPTELVLESAVEAPIEQPKPAVTAGAAFEETPSQAAKTLPTPRGQARVRTPIAAAPAHAVKEQPVVEAPKPAAPPLPQGFEGLKFPNDGVLTRQWMEFLSQMSAAK
jgi:hypothetical protein